MTVPAEIRVRETTFVAMDLEATGVAFGHDRIIEIGAVRFRLGADGRVTPGERFHTLVNPSIPLPPPIARLTGLTEDGLRAGPALESVWDEFTAFLAGTVVIAHHVQSDLAWLASEALRIDRRPIALPFFCTLQIARRCVPKAPKHALAALVAHLGLNPGEHHRALADALHTRNLFAHCVASAGATDLGALGLRHPESWPTPDRFVVQLPEHLVGLHVHLADQTAVLMRYRGGSQGSALRPVTPLGFFAASGVPYLRAWCHLADDARSFRCDRIRAWQPHLDGEQYADF